MRPAAFLTQALSTKTQIESVREELVKYFNLATSLGDVIGVVLVKKKNNKSVIKHCRPLIAFQTSSRFLQIVYQSRLHFCCACEKNRYNFNSYFTPMFRVFANSGLN